MQMKKLLLATALMPLIAFGLAQGKQASTTVHSGRMMPTTFSTINTSAANDVLGIVTSKKGHLQISTNGFDLVIYNKDKSANCALLSGSPVTSVGTISSTSVDRILSSSLTKGVSVPAALLYTGSDHKSRASLLSLDKVTVEGTQTTYHLTSAQALALPSTADHLSLMVSVAADSVGPIGDTLKGAITASTAFPMMVQK